MTFLAMVILSAQVEDDGPVWIEEEGSQGGVGGLCAGGWQDV